jgi:hypothetical protein
MLQIPLSCRGGQKCGITKGISRNDPGLLAVTVIVDTFALLVEGFFLQQQIL